MADKSYTDTIHDAPLLYHDNGDGTYSPVTWQGGAAALPAGTALLGKVGIDQVTAGANIVALTRNASATYIASGTGYAGYATPTDLLTLRGSASKTIAVMAMNIRISTTAAAIQTVLWIKRSTANTGGTSTNPAGIPFSSARAAASAQVDLYTAAPTLGTAVGTMVNSVVTTTVLTGIPAPFSLTSILQANGTSVTLTEPLLLRGANEMICANWNGAALPGGFLAQWDITWVEF